jgi:hypothetical protein
MAILIWNWNYLLKPSQALRSRRLAVNSRATVSGWYLWSNLTTLLGLYGAASETAVYSA